MYESARPPEVVAMLGIESEKADAEVRPGLPERSDRERHVVVMDRRMQQSAPSAHRVLPEKADRMAHVDLRKADSEDSLRELGECLDFARQLAGWNLKQLAGKMPPAPQSEERDPRQVQRWIDGKERVQLDVVFAVPELRAPFVIALARLADCCEEETTLRFRRRA